MATDLRAYIKVASNANVFFTNTSQDDVIVYPTSNSQKILLGNTGNTTAAVTITSNNIFLANNVGVGKSNPAYTLDVNGTVNFSGSLMQSGVVYQASRWASNSTVGIFVQSNVAIQGPASSCNQLVVYGSIGFSNLGYTFLATSNNLIGVGLSNPSQRLTVAGGMLGGTVENTAFGFDSSSNARLGIIKKSGTQPVFGTTSNSPMAFSILSSGTSVYDNIGTNTLTEVMRIHTNSNVGINTTTPSEQLHVVGNIYSTSQFLNNSNDSVTAPSFAFKEDSDTGMYHASNNAIGFVTNSNERIRITDVGNVGVGLSNPTERLHVSGKIASESQFLNNGAFNSNIPCYSFLTDSNTGMYNAAADALGFVTGGTERVRITSAGNVGIGVAAPNAQLQLNNSLVNRKIVLYEDANNDHQYLGLGVNTTIFRYQVPATNNHHVFYAATNSTTSTELMRITGTGTVGINTSSPNSSSRLHVVGNTIIDGCITINGATAGGDGVVSVPFEVDAANVTQTYCVFGPNGSINDYAMLRQIGGADAMHLTLDYHDNGIDAGFSIRDIVSTTIPDTITTRFTVQRGGGVGIGLSNPSQPLTVNGNILGGNIVDNSAFGFDAQPNARLGIIKKALAGPVFATTATNPMSFSIFSSSTSVFDAINTNTLKEVMRIHTNSNVGINTIDPTEQLHVNGKVYSTSQFLNNSNDSVNAPSFSFKEDSNTGMFHPANDTLGFVTGGVERVRVLDNGNVGINTSQPLYNLHVRSNMMIQGAFDNSNYASHSRIYMNDANFGIGVGGLLHTGNQNCLQFWAFDGEGRDIIFFHTSNGLTDPVAWRRELVIKGGTGNVGIGKSNPSELLHVAGKIASDTQFLNNSVASAELPCYSFLGDSNTGMYNAAADALGFATNGSEKVRITSTGNVGIGLSNPSQPLTVNGSILGGNTVDNSAFGFDAQSNARLGMVKKLGLGPVFATAASNPMIFSIFNNSNSLFDNIGSTTLTEVMRIHINSNVGVNTIDPTEQLHVNGKVYSTSQFLNNSNDSVNAPSFSFKEDSNTGIFHPSNDSLGFVTGGVERMRVTDTGNVGIGKSNPQYNLHVMSNMMVQGVFYDSNYTRHGRIYMNDTNFGIGAGGFEQAIGLDCLYFWAYDGVGRDIVFCHTTNGLTDPGAWRRELVIKGVTGNVGIGKSNPLQQLHVAGKIATDTQFLFVGSSNSNIPCYSFLNNSNTGMYNAAANAIGFVTGGTECARLTSNGIGIGVSAPNAAIQLANIASNRRIVLWDTNNNDNQYYGLGINWDIFRYQVPSGANHVFYIGVDASTSKEVMRIGGANSNVGIGTTAPSETLHVAGNIFATTQILASSNDTASSPGFAFKEDSNTGMFHASNDAIGFTTAGTERVRINNSGNVGIGTTTPMNKLDVVGNVQVSGSITASSGDSQTRSLYGITGARVFSTNQWFRLATVTADVISSSFTLGVRGVINFIQNGCQFEMVLSHRSDTSSFSASIRVAGNYIPFTLATPEVDFVVLTADNETSVVYMKHRMGYFSMQLDEVTIATYHAGVINLFPDKVFNVAWDGNILATDTEVWSGRTLLKTDSAIAVATITEITGAGQLALRGHGAGLNIETTNTTARLNVRGNLRNSSLASGVAAWYSFDSSPQGNDINGGATLALETRGVSFTNPTGKLNKCIQYANPTNATATTYSIITAQNIANTRALPWNDSSPAGAVSCWFQLDTNATATWAPVIFFYGYDNSLFALRAHIVNGNILTVVYNNSNTLTMPAAVVLGTWYHLVVSLGAGSINVYVNGQLIANAAISTISNTHNFAIGSSLSQAVNPASAVSSGINGWLGEIDEFVIMNRAVTLAEVQTLYTLTFSAAFFEGNVGINTTSPSEQLHVVGNIYSTSQFLNNSNDTVSAPGFAFKEDSDTGMYHASNNSLGFVAGGTERMRVLEGGNVGIGTTTPAYPLHVPGNVSLTNRVFFRGLYDYGGTTTNRRYAILTTMTQNQGMSRVILTGGGSESILTGQSKVYADLYIDARVGYVKGTAHNQGSTATLGTGIAIYRNTTTSDLTVYITGGNFLAYEVEAHNIAQSTTPSNLVWSADTVFTPPAGTALMFDTLTHVPTDTTFATVYATASSVTSNLVQLNNGNTGFSTSNPTERLHVNGKIVSETQFLNNGVINSNIPCYSFLTNSNTGMYNAAANALGFVTNSNERVRITDIGNVGIGLSNPSERLQVVGKVVTDSQYLFAGGSNSNIPCYSFMSNSNTGMYHAASNVIGFVTGGTERVRITSNGLGINATPSAPLQIAPTSSTDPALNAVYIYNSNVSTSQHAILALRTTNAGGGNPYLSWDIFGVGGWCMGIDNADADKLKIATDWNSLTGQTRFTFDRSGNMGIGTTSPGENLHVVGKAFAATQVLASSNDTAAIPGFTFRENSNTGMYHASNNAVGFVTGGVERVRITDNGNMGVGTTAPTYPLHVLGNASFANRAVFQGAHDYPSTFHATTNRRYALLATMTQNQGMARVIMMGGGAVSTVATGRQTFVDMYVDARNGYVKGNVHNQGAATTFGAGIAVYTNSNTNNISIYMTGAPFFAYNVEVQALLQVTLSSNVSWSADTVFAPPAGDVLMYDTLTHSPPDSLFSTVYATRTTISSNFTQLVNGNVGIGLSNPSHALHVTGKILSETQVLNNGGSNVNMPCYSFLNNSNTGMYNAGVNALGFVTNSNERVRINAAGQVGIGTSNPAYTLDVVGSINFTNSLFQNGVLFQPGGGGGGAGWSNDTNGVSTLSNIGIKGPSTTGDELTVYGNIALSNFGLSTIHSSNNHVGIGVADPLYYLHIRSNMMIQGVHANVNYLSHGRVYFNDTAFGIGTGRLVGAGNDCLYLWAYDDVDRDIVFSHTTNGATNPGGWKRDMTIKAVSGNVGIGLSNPAERLHVTGKIATDTQFLFIGGSNSNIPCYSFLGNSNTGMYNAATNELGFVTGGTERVRITSAGNIGIGTTTPNAALQLANVAANRRIILWEGFNNDHQYYGLGINTGIFRYQIDNTGASHAFYTGTSSTTSTELMRITGTGRVGVGTAAPDEALHVVGKVFASTQVMASSNDAVTAPGFTFRENSNKGMYSATLNEIGFVTGGIEHLRITSTGNIGISNVSPSERLHVRGKIASEVQFLNNGGVNVNMPCYSFLTNSNTGMYNAATNSIGFVTNANERVRINPAGYVGIGTTAPLYPLHVAAQSNNISIQADFDIVAYSDARLKTDLTPITSALEKIDKITGYTFHRIGTSNAQKVAGVISQEVREVLPEVVYENPDGIMSVAYGNMSALLIEAIKELKKEVAEIKRVLNMP